MPFAENVDECGRHQCGHCKSRNNKNNKTPIKEENNS